MSPERLMAGTGCSEDAAEQWADLLTRSMARFNIDTPNRQAFFLANVAHESARFTRTRESLNYSTAGLLATFPRYFTPAEAVEFAHQPERIANRVYARRMGNGDEASGDGFAFRGGGLIHLSGKTAYRLCGQALDVDLLTTPARIAAPRLAALSACWYWHENRLNRWADADDFDGCCDCINIGRKTARIGDANGYAGRLALLQRWRRVDRLAAARAGA